MVESPIRAPGASITALVLAPVFPPAFGGIERLSYRLVSGFRAVRARVLALDEPGAGEFDRRGNLDIRRVTNTPRGGRRSIARLNTAATVEAARRRPDVVLSMHIRASYSAALCRRTLGIPFVQYVHAMELAEYPRLARGVLERASATIAVSAYSAELATWYGASPERLHVIPPGVDLPTDAPGPRRAPSPPTIVTVSRLDDDYKGHDVIIDALPRIRTFLPEIRWTVIGGGRLRGQLERHARTLGVDDVVSFLGAVDDATRDRALASADAFVLPSRVAADGSGGEGFGIAYLEAAARGLPVIAARSGGATDAVLDGETGVLVEPGNADALARAVVDLLSSPGRCGALGARGIEHARGFAWPEIVERVERVLRAPVSSGATR